jgi:Spondin_N
MIKQSLAALTLTLASTTALAQPLIQYEVTLTNITPGQTFTPQLVVTHPGNVQLFKAGEPASSSLEILAEGGNTAPLTEDLVNVATDAVTIGGLLGPGESTSTVITGSKKRGYISVAAMLIPTNDTFVALNRVPLPSVKSPVATYSVPAYDAGTEYNDQSCQHIPGPRCGGEGFSAEPGEGFVHIGNGFHELGNEDADGFEVLGPQTYDWRNSVAQITVRRIKNN